MVTRQINRLVRATAAARSRVVPPKVDEEARKQAEKILDEQLRMIANNDVKIAALTKANADAAEYIEQILTKQKMLGYANGLRAAEMVDVYSRESREVDPKTLFNNKAIKREDYFSVVKVQMGELKKFMAENEILAIAKVDKAVKMGRALKITPVKMVSATKPASKPRAKK